MSNHHVFIPQGGVPGQEGEKGELGTAGTPGERGDPRGESNPGHIGGRQVLSPRYHPCSPLMHKHSIDH